MSSKIRVVIKFTIAVAVGLAIYVLILVPSPMNTYQDIVPPASIHLPFAAHFLTQKTSDSRCYNDKLVRYYRSQNSLPGKGWWDGADHFHPELCDLRNSTMPPSDLLKCFQKKNVKHVMTIGDSNGKAYFRAATRAIGKAFPFCNETRVEKLINGGFDPQPSYYCLGDRKMEAALQTENRGCRTCVSSTYECLSGTEHFAIEHISMARIWGQSLSFKKGTKDFSADSYQEIIFKYYIPKVKPDLILMFPPFNHLLRRPNYQTEQQNMAKAYGLFKKYVPKTMVVWMPGFAEFEKDKKKDMKNKKYHGLFPTDIIPKLNQDMFNMLKDDLIHKPNIVMSFFDLLPMSLSRSQWARDGVHMIDIWYDKVFDYWLQTYCN